MSRPARPRWMGVALGAAALLTACASASAGADPAVTVNATIPATTATAGPTAARATTTTVSTTVPATTAVAATGPSTTAVPEADDAASGDGDPGAASPAYPAFAPTSAVAIDRPADPGDTFSSFDQSIESSLFGRGALGVSVAVAKNGRVLHTQAFGTANPYTGERATTASRFRIASVSKTLLAVTVLRLAQQGRLGLDDPVGDRLARRLGVAPLGDPAEATITVRQLLSHTSGFPEYQRTFFGGTVPDCRDAARRGLARGLVGAPGTVYRYSNLNYCLLGLLVDDVTGQSYEQVVKDQLLAPLGIDDMRVAGTFDTRPGDVVHPTGQGRRFMEALGAAGNWIGTASDLVKVFDSIDPARPGEHPLPPDLAAAMTVRAPVVYPHTDSWYGLGLIVWDNGAAWGHTGTVESARTMVFHRADGVTWAILVNGNTPSNTPDLRKFVDKALATVVLPP